MMNARRLVILAPALSDRAPWRPLATLTLTTLLLAVSTALPAAATIHRYDTTSSGAIPSTAGTYSACLSSGLTRTFTVSSSFTVSNIALGLNISHNNRGDLAAVLYAPDGSYQLFVSPSGDGDNDYDILVSSNSDGSGNPALDDNSSDPTGEPYYARLVNLPGADFYTGNAAGTWTLDLCDIANAGTTGTLNRARLVLTSTETAAPVCTGTSTYAWASNGNNNAFSSQTVDGVTLSLTSTRDLTNDGANTNGRTNFTTQTGTFGAQTGYYIMQFDDGANGGPQNPEAVLLETNWSFSSPVRELSWTNLDIDNGAWEDYVRLTARDTNGAMVPYQLIPGTAHEPAGDVLESDVGNIADNDDAGNATYIFDGPVKTITLEYMRGDDFTNPNSQRIGIGNVSWCGFDFGDAPSSYGDMLSNGPRHALNDRSIYLGANPPDGEADGQPGATATGDDASQIGGVDDEDGVSAFPSCPGDGTYTVIVNATNQSGTNAYLVGYVDWDGDGTFNTSDERSTTVTVPTGTSGSNVAVTWSSVPADCGGSVSTYARFRITSSQTRAQSPTDGAGLQAPDGEVEDYEISAGTLPVTVAWAQSAPLAGQGADGSVDLRFATATENRNVAFRIWDMTSGREPSLLATVPSKVVDSFEPQDYEVRLSARGAGGIGAFGIEDVAIDGRGRLHGPFTVGSTVGKRPKADVIDWSAIKRDTGVVSLADRMAAAETSGGDGAPSGFATRTGFGVAADSTDGALLLVREAGIHRVSYEDLQAAGVDFGNVPASQLTLTDGADGVPMVVEPAGQFGPGSSIEFLADPSLTLASPVDVYTLRAHAAGGLRSIPQVVDLPATLGGRVSSTRAVVRHHPDNEFSPSAPDGDPWYDTRILALGGPGTVTRTFDLPELTTGQAKLTLDLWGFTHFDGTSPDHHVVVHLNGVELTSTRFDGLVPWSETFTVTGLVRRTGNVLEITLPGDTGYDFDLVNLEGFSVDYRRTAAAIDGRFDGAVSGYQQVGIGGFGTPGETVVGWFDLGQHAGRPERGPGGWRPGRQTYGRIEVVPQGGRIAVPAAAGQIHMASVSHLLHPAIVAGIPEPVTASSAEYLIITHPAFADSLDDLVGLETSRGFDTEVVTVDHIYAAYSDHQPSAEAIRQFTAASEARYPGRLRYVLLVGADTTDPYDHLGTGSVSYVPSAYASPVSDISFGPTDELLVDGDGDGLGDVPVGRLPVHSPSELTSVVDKLYAWQGRAAGVDQALLISGSSDKDRTLADVNQGFADDLAGWNVTRVQVDDVGTGAARTAALTALDTGTPVVSFVGHSSIGAWELTPILQWQDVASLTNSGLPSLVLQWGCWSSYYLHPTVQSTSGELILAPDRGAAGTIGATTLTYEDSHQRLGEQFFRQVAKGATTVGEALHAAKAELHREGRGRDAVLSMILLGDPAMPLPALDVGPPVAP